ncbi:MAG: Crp/Fnr family transcriptional regulator, partial [Rubripirellula sp.]
MSLEKTNQLLQLHDSTRELSSEQVEQIAEHAEIVEFPSGHTIHSYDSPMKGLLLLSSGEVELLVTTPDGSSQPIQYLGRDDQLGLLSLFQTEPFPITVNAIQQTTGILIRTPEVITLLQALPLWRRAMMTRIGPRLRTVLQREKRRRRPRVVTFLH